MTAGDFAFLARLLGRRSGLHLTPDKLPLVQRRLVPVMQRFDFKDMDALLAELRLGREALAQAVTEAMCVNDTGFFRDADVFGRLQARVLPRLASARAGEKRLRLWSAATATGQEAYSLAVLLAEMGLSGQGWNIEIIATDLSAQALERAERGRYAGYEIERGLDPRMVRWFRRDGREWVVDDALRRMISFHRFNLLDSFGWLDDLDLILCRNVLMYFDSATCVSVLERLADTLSHDGALVLGDTEMPHTEAFVASGDGAGIYMKSHAAVAWAS
jgi:chemotaxis protein methyltransferase CheR